MGLGIMAFFLLGNFCSAAVADPQHNFAQFDAAVLVKGGRVASEDDNFYVSLTPNQFKSKLTLKVDKVEDDSLLPFRKKPVSDFFEYDLKTGQSGFLNSPLSLSFSKVESFKSPVVYFYDNHWQTWRPLKTEVDLKNKQITAKTIFPFARVVVLDEGFAVDGAGLTARAAVVIDKATGNVVFEKNQDLPRSIASLTKLMTALIFLETGPDWQAKVPMQESDYVGGATLWVKKGDIIKVEDLFYAMMVGSKNNAVKALVRSTGLTEKQFVGKMNKRAKELGLIQTNFVEPTGLDDDNTSTARELSVIAKEVFKNPNILKATTTKWYQIKPVNSKLTYPVQNTSFKVLDKDLYVTGSKTGWTDEAGYCLVTQAKSEGRELLALVLGAQKTRNYEEVYNLLKKYL